MKKNIIFTLITAAFLLEAATLSASSNARNINRAAVQRALNRKNVQPNPHRPTLQINRSRPAGTSRVPKMVNPSRSNPAMRRPQAVRQAVRPSVNRAPQPARRVNVRPTAPARPAARQRAQPVKPAAKVQARTTQRPAAQRNIPARGRLTPAQSAAARRAQAGSIVPVVQPSIIAPAAQIAPPVQAPVIISSPAPQPNINVAALSDELIKAVQRGNINEVTRLIQLPGVNINYHAPADPRSIRPNAGGNTPLHEALKKLREKGTNAYATIARLLIDNPQIDVSARNDAQATPLFMLAGILSERGAINAQQGKRGVIQNNEEAHRPDLAEIGRALIQKGADVNALDMNNRTALHWATNNGYLELARTLIDSGANPNIQDVQGRTPLIKAAQKGYLRLLQLLIDAGANPNLQDFNKGRTALHWVQRMREGAVIKSGNQMTKERALDAMRILLNAGANPTLTDKVTTDNSTARSPIYWAQQKSPWPMNDNKELNLLMSYAKSCTIISRGTGNAGSSGLPSYAY